MQVDINEGEDVDRAIYQFTNYERQTKVLDEVTRCVSCSSSIPAAVYH